MKVSIGIEVIGIDGHGPVLAMTNQWCIYVDKETGEQLAERWEFISVQAEPDETRLSAYSEPVVIETKADIQKKEAPVKVEVSSIKKKRGRPKKVVAVFTSPDNKNGALPFSFVDVDEDEDAEDIRTNLN